MSIVRVDASYERIIYNVVVLSSNVKQMIEQRVKSDVKISFENNQKNPLSDDRSKQSKGNRAISNPTEVKRFFFLPGSHY